jgi:hypothetical protein
MQILADAQACRAQQGADGRAVLLIVSVPVIRRELIHVNDFPGIPPPSHVQHEAPTETLRRAIRTFAATHGRRRPTQKPGGKARPRFVKLLRKFKIEASKT